jgi:hypothetical protein
MASAVVASRQPRTPGCCEAVELRLKVIDTWRAAWGTTHCHRRFVAEMNATLP